MCLFLFPVVLPALVGCISGAIAGLTESFGWAFRDAGLGLAFGAAFYLALVVPYLLVLGLFHRYLDRVTSTQMDGASGPGARVLDRIVLFLWVVILVSVVAAAVTPWVAGVFRSS